MPRFLGVCCWNVNKSMVAPRRKSCIAWAASPPWPQWVHGEIAEMGGDHGGAGRAAADRRRGGAAAVAAHGRLPAAGGARGDGGAGRAAETRPALGGPVAAAG